MDFLEKKSLAIFTQCIKMMLKIMFEKTIIAILLKYF